MTIGTRVNSTTGVVSTNNAAGFSIAKSASSYGFMPFKVDDTTAVTATGALADGDAGMFTVSGSAALTVTMPLASSCAGAVMMFKATSADAHVLTGSAEAGGVTVFCDATTVGSRLTLKTTVANESVALMSDGTHFVVLGSMSGSYTIAGA